MMTLSTRTKSVALAFAMIVSSSNTECFSLSNPFAGMGSCLNKETLIVAAVAAGLIAKIRLDTKPRRTYNYDNWQDDILALLNSYNIFDAASRATIIKFFDKYFVGSKFRLDEQTTRTKEDDGSVVTIKRNKVAQKPSGAMGLFDAYIFQQLKTNSELLPVAAVMYLFVTTPQTVWQNALTKALEVAKKQS